MVDLNVEAVKIKLAQRSARGIHKYGVTTSDAKLGRFEWLTHLQEELLDAAIYVEAMLAKERESYGIPPTDKPDASC